MEDNFRLTLIIISAIVIVAIFAHGFWTLRKNRNPYKLKPEKNIVEDTTYDESYDRSGFDYTGVSKPRVVGVNPLNENEIPTTAAPAPDYAAEPIPKDYEQSNDETYEGFDNENSQTTLSTDNFQPSAAVHDENKDETIEEKPVQVQKPLYDEPVTQAKPNSFKHASKTLRESLKPKKAVKTPKTDIKRDQLEINFGDASAIDHSLPRMSAIEEPVEATVEPAKEPLMTIDPEVIILSVVMPEGESMSGAMLLPTLLTLGLKFGDMDIFHRHEDNAGNGKVTFSLANIMNPGTFNLDEIETFNTQGVSLFMTLPNAGDSFEVFEKMLNCAKQLALEFKGQVLDDKRSVMTKQTEQHYMSRIRDFTRKHRIATL